MSLRLKNWKDRPPEVANLLNPAYLSILLSKMCSGYAKPRIGMPFPLAFVGLPLILHRGTAEILPKTSRTRLHLWLDQNPEVTFSFGVRAAGCAPYVRECISFGVRVGVLRLESTGAISGKALKTPKQWEESSSPQIAIKRAELVGKLFANVSSVSTVFAMLGVRP